MALGCSCALIAAVAASQLYEVIGRGSSSYVQKAVHKPTGTWLALKVINMFDKTKRGALITEIRALYDAECPWCARRRSASDFI